MDAGRVLHYQRVRLLGRGGMGEVVEAVDTRLGRRVALKFVAPEFAADSIHLMRLEREARAAAGLNHPNIAVVHAFETAGEQPFLVMELLPGRTLRSLLADGALPLPDALRIARETASALAFAHRHGIVHRDVKPENVMFDAHGKAKLTDFGLAQAADAPQLTRTGTALGTACYMSPERIEGRTEAASDVFALGVMLHEMLAGERPFAGDGALGTMYAIANQPPKALQRPDAGERVAALVTSMLDKSPDARPTAGEVETRLTAEGGSILPPGAAIPFAAPRGPAESTLELPVVPRHVAATPGTKIALPADVVPDPRRPSRTIRALLLGLALVTVFAAGPVLRWLETRVAARTAQALAANDLGAQALVEEELDQAERHFREALRLDARLHRAAVGLAAVLAERGQRSEAATRLAALLDDIPRDDHELRAATWSHLAVIAMADGNWPDAVAKSRIAFVEDSSAAAAYNQLGYALLRNGAPDSARSLLLRGIERFPGVAALHKNAGLAALSLQDTDDALGQAEAALDADATYAPAWALRARAHARAGNRSGARAAYERFRAFATADSAELADLARELATRGVTLNR